MITVCLYGDLRQYGRRFNLHAESPAEALHALFTQIDGLREYIRNGVYQVRFKRQDHSEDSIRDTFKQPDSGVLHIVPRVAGAGRNGALQTIIGVVLIVVGYFTWAYGGQVLVSAGVGMVLGGVAQMLTKQPDFDSSSGAESSRNTSFSNLSNTAAQGRPVPLAYGICYCGSRVISQGVESRRIQTGADSKSISTGNSVVKMVAEAAGVDATGNDPLAVDLTLGMEKTYTRGVAATAPNGQKYETDFNDDSVRARNYQASYTVK
ncbi:phage tail assembly protein [Neisseria arctica]|uniref:Phage tail assembly protein n=1 Tax=Neisseria arctica TaxID=1470200 RepID=A0A0J1C4K7_9NEIS|nr:tail assembly protein [Neisseria arctica]KLT73243.1 phage tail assembly protein [Neisseria arctica]UOO87506.1 tail assembly protein [Neisseria arctica]